MKKIKVAIIGAGNISNTRHIPALKKLKDAKIVGVVGVKQANLDKTMQRHRIKNSLLLKRSGNFARKMNKSQWFGEVDAVVIGAPPRDHFALIEASLLNGKHVLVEKPMTMDKAEADTLIALAKKMKKVFYVMHNFQFATGMLKLERLIQEGELGDIVSFFEFQLTNKNRRLPEWYNDLPLGLFYDEAPHFIYLLDKFGGKIKIENAHAQFNDNKNDNTPLLMSVNLRAGKVPANIFLNFESPICEWYFVISGSKKIAFYDLFKDILVVLPSDNEHYAADILKNSWRATFQYWIGFFKNGLRLLTGNLLYGHDVVLRKFLDAIQTGQVVDGQIGAEKGRSTIMTMNDIDDIIKKKGSRR
ncbi:MAG: Gfo/Idh/MocA family oxidoreductase [Candidatus Microsaccharimonas sp.]